MIYLGKIHLSASAATGYQDFVTRPVKTITFTSKLLVLAFAVSLLGAGCSIRRIALNKVGDALAGGGTTFASEDDPELAKAAAPFSLKLIESLPIQGRLLRACYSPQPAASRSTPL